VIVVDDGVAPDPLLDLNELPVEGHQVRLEAPVLPAREVRGEDAQRIVRVLGLVVEAGGDDAEPLQDPVDPDDVGDRERQDADSFMQTETSSPNAPLTSKVPSESATVERRSIL
jgi:hypothetical protein